MPETSPEEVAKVYRDRFRHEELEPFPPDGAAGMVRREMASANWYDDNFEQRCELCPLPDLGDHCQLDCRQVRREADAADGVSVSA